MTSNHHEKIIIRLLLISGYCTSTALSAQETLVPCDTEFLSGYYKGVDLIIDQAINQEPEISLTVIPSFFPEDGIRLMSNRVYYVQLKSSFWEQARFLESGWVKRATKTVKKIKTESFNASLDPILVDRIKLTYKNAIAKAKETDQFGLDGVTYRFSIPDAGCGETWSPEKSSPNGQLAALYDLLVSHSKLTTHDDIHKSEKSIKEFLNTLSPTES